MYTVKDIIMQQALDTEDTLWYTDSYEYPPKTDRRLVIYKCNKDTEINFNEP